jgi:hypothetical protein
MSAPIYSLNQRQRGFLKVLLLLSLASVFWPSRHCKLTILPDSGPFSAMI